MIKVASIIEINGKESAKKDLEPQQNYKGDTNQTNNTR